MCLFYIAISSDRRKKTFVILRDYNSVTSSNYSKSAIKEIRSKQHCASINSPCLLCASHSRGFEKLIPAALYYFKWDRLYESHQSIYVCGICPTLASKANRCCLSKAVHGSLSFPLLCRRTTTASAVATICCCTLL